jgi:hypothetical protein
MFAMRVPIACTLTAEELPDRIDEWRTFMASSVVDTERPAGTRLRLRLEPSERTLVRAADLAQRERACCGFFDFSIDVQTDALWLVVRVPDEAAGILDDFAGLAPSSS